MEKLVKHEIVDFNLNKVLKWVLALLFKSICKKNIYCIYIVENFPKKFFLFTAFTVPFILHSPKKRRKKKTTKLHLNCILQRQLSPPVKTDSAKLFNAFI